MKRTWPYFSTPLLVFLIVVTPICIMMAMLAYLPHRPWIRITGVAVIVISVYGLVRGYVRRLVLTEDGPVFCTLLARRAMRWSDVKRVDEYVPGGGVNGIRYVYITAQDRPPRGKWEQDERTFQLQSRPGLLDALRAAWKK